jgi:acetyl-CoA synthetase
MTTARFRTARDFLLRHRADYDTAARAFRWPTLERFNWALDWFDAELASGRNADRIALRLVGEKDSACSFAELSERSNRVANGLRELGVARGDRLLLMLGNTEPLWVTMLAAMKLGAVVIPATTLLTADDVLDRIGRGGVRHLVAAASDAAKLDAVAGDVTRIALGEAAGWHSFATLLETEADFTPDRPTEADDPLLLYFTSGTTAKPKLVLHTHQSYPAGHLATMYQIGLQPGDVHLNISSPGWAKHAWSSFFAPWNAGATILALTHERFDAKQCLNEIVRCGVTTFCAPPTVWRMLIQQDLGAWPVTLREVVSAGEPLNPEIIERVERAWGLTIRDFYGQTETTVQIGNPPGQRVKAGAMGRPMPGYTIHLLDIDGAEAEEGEIAMALPPPPRPPPMPLMRGYQGEGGALLPLEGPFYRTGDIASRDPDGYLTYVGRADDVFKASDYRISPFELESVLIEHPAVTEAAIVPAPDAMRLAIPKAFVSLAAGWPANRDTAAALFAHLRTRLAPYKRVRRIEFAELPKTISGKIRRVELRRAEQILADRGERSEAEFRDEDFPA